MLLRSDGKGLPTKGFPKNPSASTSTTPPGGKAAPGGNTAPGFWASSGTNSISWSGFSGFSVLSLTTCAEIKIEKK